MRDLAALRAAQMPSPADHRSVACRTCGAPRWTECVDLEVAGSNKLFTGHASRKAAAELLAGARRS